MKSRVLPWAVGVAILGCVLAVSANVTTSNIHQSLNNERHVRMALEQELQTAALRIRSLETQLSETQKKFDGIEAILNQGRTRTNDLQSRLDAATKEKEVMAKELAEIQAVTPEAR